MKLADASQISLIDYEYGMWNPMYYDLANYLNELVCDNSYPLGIGIRYYWQNWPSDQEIEYMTKLYYELWAQSQKGIKNNFNLARVGCRTALTMTKQCMILNNYKWAVWAIMKLNEADELNPDYYTWEYLLGRCEMHQRQVN